LLVIKKVGLILDGYGSTFTFDEKTGIPSYSLDEIKIKNFIKIIEGHQNIWIRKNN